MEHAVTAADDDISLSTIEGEETGTTLRSLLEKHPLKLFQRVITVSSETMKTAPSLPRLNIG